jgi:hypothetical protein
LQNVRSALEYLVWELARAEIARTRSNKSTPSGTTSFPIYLKRKAFMSDRLKKLQDLGPYARAVIEELQPYHRSYVSSGGVVNMHAPENLHLWF